MECLGCGRAFQLFDENVVEGTDTFVICPHCRRFVHAFYYAARYGERDNEITYEPMKVYKETEK